MNLSCLECFLQSLPGKDWSPCPTFCLITAPRQVFLFLLMNDEQDIVSALLLSFLIMPSNSCSILLAEMQVGICRSCLKMLTRLLSCQKCNWHVSKAMSVPNKMGFLT